jgi:hypothetical protein
MPFAIECQRWERNLKIQTILPLALASLVSGCGGQMSSNEAGLLDAVAFIIGGQQEGAIPQGFETHWRRTVATSSRCSAVRQQRGRSRRARSSRQCR